MKKWIFILAFGIFCLVILFSQAFSQQDIFKIKLEVKTQKDLLLLKEIGMNCPDMGECICEANLSQLNRLRRSHYSYTAIKQGIRIKAPSLDAISGSNGTNYYIHDYDTTYSFINITGAPECATMDWIEIALRKCKDLYLTENPNMLHFIQEGIE